MESGSRHLSARQCARDVGLQFPRVSHCAKVRTVRDEATHTFRPEFAAFKCKLGAFYLPRTAVCDHDIAHG